MNKLLTRDQFREAVFERDGHACVVCKQPAADAHHILERRLFPDGGYYIANGASVCSHHHKLCEMTTISVEEIREACKITKPVIPPHLYGDQRYDKWGNPILPNGRRLKGELFSDPSVQKILREGGVLDDFTHWVKYPRTHHLPWSEGVTDDDRVMSSLASFEGRRVIITEKMDGENTTMYSDYIHARSVDGQGHPSRAWVKQFWSTICGDIPPQWRVCGENLYAKHSIPYMDLETYFMGFSIWDERNVCLDWDTTMFWFELLGITPVPVLYDGVFDEQLARNLAKSFDTNKSEGHCIRIADEFAYGAFRDSIGKVVRKGHVQTSKHWFFGQAVVKNVLKGAGNG